MFLSDVPLEVQKQIQDDDNWWYHRQVSTVAQFLSQYSLHDSYICDMNLSYFETLRITLRWDVAGIDPNQKKLDLLITTPSGNRDFYSEAPYLCILFGGVHQTVSNQHEYPSIDSGIGSAETTRLSPEQRDLWLDHLLGIEAFDESAATFLLDESVHCTTIEGFGKNRFQIIHREPTYFLCIRKDGSLLQLPDLAPPTLPDSA